VDYTGLGVQQVWECTGAFLDRATLQPYFDKGVPKVVVSAPVKDPNPVLNVVMGCNHVSVQSQQLLLFALRPSSGLWGVEPGMVFMLHGGI
jgi:glyceraldehyde-3-phosphate dehydrogenase/erythrose-4-phosphate dehydrogenase